MIYEYLRFALVHAVAHDRGRRLIASVGQVYISREVGGAIAQCGRSLISTILFFVIVYFGLLIDLLLSDGT